MRSITALASPHRVPTVPNPIHRADCAQVSVPVDVSLCLVAPLRGFGSTARPSRLTPVPGQRKDRRKTNDQSGHGDDHWRPPGASGAGGSGDRGLLLRAGAGHRFLPEGALEHRRRFLPRRPRNDGVDRRPQFSFRKPGSAGADGLGRGLLSIRHPRSPLVLDRRNSGHAVPRPGHDAVLLHLQNALGSRLLEIAFRRSQPRAVRDFFRVHDRTDERHQHVRHGAGDESGPGMGHQFQHLGFLDHRRGLCNPWRLALRNFQRSAAVHPDLGRRTADSDPGTNRSGRLESAANQSRAECLCGIHASVVHARLLQR